MRPIKNEEKWPDKLATNIDKYLLKTSGKTAVLIEPRKHPAIEFVLTTATKHLPKDWKIQILHGNKNMTYCEKIAKTLNKERKVTCTNTNVDNFNNGYEYSEFLMSFDFLNMCDGEHILVFQTDSIFFPKAIHIDKFLHLDYVGAPWAKDSVGCGGFSLRTKRAMALAILNRYSDKPRWEDCFYSSFVRQTDGLTIANFEEANEFCVGSIYHPDPIGTHQPWNNGTKQPHPFAKKFTEDHPEVLKLFELNKVANKKD